LERSNTIYAIREARSLKVCLGAGIEGYDGDGRPDDGYDHKD
jgi:hypothetical protein